jgi:FecR protein
MLFQVFPCPVFLRPAIYVAAIVVLACPAALAQTPLKRATVTSFQNQVKLLPRNQTPRQVRVSDQMKPGDGLSTGRSSRADVRFNDGSLARIGQQVVFQFTPGTRDFELSNGTALLLIRPGQGQTRVRTPNTVTGIQGSALFIQYNQDTDETIVGALTDSGIQVQNRDQTATQTLRAGQLVVVTQGQMQAPVNFDLQTFYQTSGLANDLRLNDASVKDDDATIAEVRRETLAGLATQTAAAQTTPSPNSAFQVQQDGFFGDRSTSSTILGTPSTASQPSTPAAEPPLVTPGPTAPVGTPPVPTGITPPTTSSAPTSVNSVDSDVLITPGPRAPSQPVPPNPPAPQPPNPPTVDPKITPPNPAGGGTSPVAPNPPATQPTVPTSPPIDTKVTPPNPGIVLDQVIPSPVAPNPSATQPTVPNPLTVDPKVTAPNPGIVTEQVGTSEVPQIPNQPGR